MELNSLPVYHHYARQSAPAEDFLVPFQHQKRKDKSTAEFHFLLS
jgi:hypothetical protein